MSACAQDAQASVEFYLHHHRIDVAPPRKRRYLNNDDWTWEYPSQAQYGSRLVEHVLLVTTKRVVFGTTPVLDPFTGISKPSKIIFELPIERMARVELPKPFRKLYLWTWYTIPRSLSPYILWHDERARPNGIAERAIEGADPNQLKDAFLHLLQLTQQHERSVHVVAEQAGATGGSSGARGGSLAAAGGGGFRPPASLVDLEGGLQSSSREASYQLTYSGTKALDGPKAHGRQPSRNNGPATNLGAKSKRRGGV